MAVKSYSDFTDFADRAMNGWEVSDFVGEEAKIIPEGQEGYVLDFPTIQNKADGIVLQKQYVGLVPGNYQFGMRARSVSELSPARISVVGKDSAGSKFIIQETNLWQQSEDRWSNYYGSIDIEQDDGSFFIEIDNHNPELEGNDYRFSQFMFRSAVDVTDFETGEDEERLNGWVMREDYRLEFRDTQDEGKVLYLHTHKIEAGHKGVFLKKEYPLLVRDKKYEFSMTVMLDYPGNPPELEMKASGDVVIEKVTLSRLHEWQVFSGIFTVKDDLTSITIENHTDTEYGNDFLIAKLQVSPVPV